MLSLGHPCAVCGDYVPRTMRASGRCRLHHPRRCNGINAEGTPVHPRQGDRCNNLTRHPSGFCRLHLDQRGAPWDLRATPE